MKFFFFFIGGAAFLLCRYLLCPIFGHDWFNGGEICAFCSKPRPKC